VILAMGAHIIEEESMKLKMLTMSAEDRKKQELIMERQRETKAKMKKDAEYRKTLQEHSMKDRAEKAKEPQKKICWKQAKLRRQHGEVRASKRGPWRMMKGEA